jgi:hypothetical protein
MQNDPVEGTERLIWVEPIVESLDLRGTESNWGTTGGDGFAVADSGS